jgi:hypothetical protein
VWTVLSTTDLKDLTETQLSVTLLIKKRMGVLEAAENTDSYLDDPLPVNPENGLKVHPALKGHNQLPNRMLVKVSLKWQCHLMTRLNKTHYQMHTGKLVLEHWEYKLKTLTKPEDVRVRLKNPEREVFLVNVAR